MAIVSVAVVEMASIYYKPNLSESHCSDCFVFLLASRQSSFINHIGTARCQATTASLIHLETTSEYHQQP